MLHVLVYQVSPNTFQSELKNTPPHVRRYVYASADSSKPHCAHLFRRRAFLTVRSAGFYFWRFRYTERVAKCLWRDSRESVIPLSAGVRRPSSRGNHAQIYKFLMKNALFSGIFLHFSVQSWNTPCLATSGTILQAFHAS